MILSTTTSILFDVYGYEKGIEVAAKAGFDALDLNLCHIIDQEEFSNDRMEETCSMLKRIAQENGLYFNQAHAPEPTRILWKGTQEEQDAYNKAIQPKILAAVKLHHGWEPDKLLFIRCSILT